MDLSLEKLKEAVSIREQIHSLEQRLSSLFGGREAKSSTGRGSRGRRRMSAATRAKLVAAAKARWARRRGGESSAKSAKSAKRRSGITAAGRKKLSDAMRARWAERRKASGAKSK
jgi:hypothetical protein